MKMWLVFALMTVLCWGLYGIFLHKGQVQMADPEMGRYKSFLIVGVAYFIIAILGPALILLANKSSWSMPGGGITWSFIAGAVGAIGAFGVLLAFGAAPKPTARYVPVVMSIIFAGAPIVNALVAMSLHPPQGGWKAIPTPFYLGILLAAAGGALVTTFKPPPGQVHAAPVVDPAPPAQE